MGTPPDHPSCSSSVDSSSHLPSSLLEDTCFEECFNSGHAECDSKRSYLSTDLRLGLTFPSPHDDSQYHRSSIYAHASSQRDWPPIKPLLRSRLTGKSYDRDQTSLFIKVYMEGIPIGRKLNLHAFEGYKALVASLCHMFKTSILCPEDSDGVQYSGEYHLLTYQDKEGDWMMVGDIPWEMFLSTVKRLKITRAERC